MEFRAVMRDEIFPGNAVAGAASAREREIAQMQAFEISGDDAVIWKRIRETASGAAFEGALELFAR